MATTLNALKAKVLEANGASALETALNAYLEDGAARKLVSCEYRVYDSSHYSVLILYTEG